MIKKRLPDLGCGALGLLPSACVAWIAYRTADGVVRTGPVTFRTEFANPVWVAVAWVLVVPVWFAGRAAPSHWRGQRSSRQ